jgi:hypothetical protein
MQTTNYCDEKSKKADIKTGFNTMYRMFSILLTARPCYASLYSTVRWDWVALITCVWSNLTKKILAKKGIVCWLIILRYQFQIIYQLSDRNKLLLWRQRTVLVNINYFEKYKLLTIADLINLIMKQIRSWMYVLLKQYY